VKRALLKLEEMQATLRSVEQARQEPVAVIGPACRFWCANDPEAFGGFCARAEAVTEIPSSRWDVQAYYDPDPGKPGKMSTRFGAFLDQIDRFDPQFFGISPRKLQGWIPSNACFSR
jgi:acyl transferase domain-containing protein